MIHGWGPFKIKGGGVDPALERQVKLNEKNITNNRNTISTNRNIIDTKASLSANNIFTGTCKFNNPVEIVNNALAESLKINTNADNRTNYVALFKNNTRRGYFGLTSASHNDFGVVAEAGNLVLSGTVIDMSNKRVTKVATPTATTDAANKAYVDGLIAALRTELRGRT